MKQKSTPGGKPLRHSYAGFIRHEGLQHDRTPDGIAWLGTRLCLRELNEFMRELID